VHIAGIAFVRVECDHANRARILGAQEVVDHARGVRFGVVGFAIGAAEIAEIIEHNADGSLGREWEALTHTQPFSVGN
jgi:hypothetical protein